MTLNISKVARQCVHFIWKWVESLKVFKIFEFMSGLPGTVGNQWVNYKRPCAEMSTQTAG